MKRQLLNRCTLILFLLSTNFIFSQNTYYWVGDAGDGEWGSSGNWSTTSGGLGGSYLLPPSPLDDVVFDNNSFSPGNNIVRTSSISGAVCRDMTWTSGVTNNPIFEEDPTTDFVMLGSLVIQPNVTFRAQVLFLGNNPVTITSNGGKIGGNIYIDKPNTSLTLMDSLMLYYVTTTDARTGTIVLVNGTFDLNQKNVYANGFISEGNSVRHLDMENSIMHFRNPSIGSYYHLNYYVNSSGTLSSLGYSFYYVGNNKTVSAANSTVRSEYSYQGVYINNGTQLTFNNFEYIVSTYSVHQTSYYSNSIVNKITAENNIAHYISSTTGAEIDTVYFGLQDGVNITNAHRGIVSGNGTKFKMIKFRGNMNYGNSNNYRDRVAGSGLEADSILFNTTANDPNGYWRHSLETSSNSRINYAFFKSRGTINGASNIIKKVFFENHGYLQSNSNQIRFLEYNVNGWITGTSNVMDTLVFSPGYTYRFGVGVNNTVNGKWYASGNPCYFTEVYNVGASSTATITVNQFDPAEYDYIRFWGVTAAGSSAPIHAGVRSIDIANNTNIIFAPYDPLALLYPFGTDTLSVCSTNIPFTLNTAGFYGNTNTNFVWHNGSTLDSFVVTQPGTYSATADYGRNCYYTASLTVLDQLSVTVNENYSGSSIVCDPSNPTGEMIAVAGGSGGGTYTYSWNTTPVQTTPVLTGVPVGEYIVTVSDTSGCSAVDTATIVGPASAIVVSATSIYPDCDPSSAGTGHVLTSTTGGTTPYSYSWNTTPVQITDYASNLDAGTYKLVVTDSMGCLSDTLQVVVPSQTGAFTSSVSVTNPTGCNTTGSASTTVVGGVSPYQYFWSNDAAETSNTSLSIPVGNHNVLVVDANNCANNNLFAIVSPDNIPPVFTGCPSDTVISTSGSCDQTYSWVVPTVTDNCGVLSVTSNYSPGSTFPIGITTVTYTATDIFGNQSICSFDVTVNDNEAPIYALCPKDIIITANAGNCSATANWPVPIATDNCTIASIVGDFAPGSTFPVGVTTVTYVATDIYGNADTCTFDIIVKANPANFTVSCPGSSSNYLYWSNMSPTDSCALSKEILAPTINNLCGNTWYGTGTNSYSPGTYDFSVGTTPVVYYVTNGADTLTCSFSVTVYDNAYPQVVSGTFPSSIYENADTCGGKRVTWTPPTFIDNCGIDTIWSTHQPGDFFNTGGTYVYYYVIDVNGRQQNFGFYVSISNPNPVVTDCPSSINVPANICGGAVVNWTPPTIVDNCYTLTSTHNPGDTFPPGNTLVTYTVTPQDGGSVRTCSFYVNVQPYQNTVTNCPNDITINLPSNKCDTVVSWLIPQFNHPCGIDSVRSNYTPGTTFLPGSYTIIYTAYVGDGSTLICSFDVTINAYSAPVVVTNCPSSGVLTFQVDTTLFCNETPVNWPTPTFTTSACVNSIDTVIYTSTIAVGDTLAIGTYNVDYSAYDVNSNLLGQCVFTVEVVDNLSQVVTVSCQQDTTIQIDHAFSCDSAIVAFNVPQFQSVGCAPLIDTVYSNIYSGDTLEIGIYTVTYVALDSNGNVLANCSFNLNIEDTLSSLIVNCPGTYNSYWGGMTEDVYMNPVTCQAAANWQYPTFVSPGGCAGLVDTIIQVAGDTIGTVYTSVGSQNYVEYQALDSNGMILETCRFTPMVIFHDSTFVFPPSDTVLYTDPITCEVVYNWSTPSFPGYCGFSSYMWVNSYSDNWWGNGLDPYQNNANQSFPIGVYNLSYQYYNGAYYSYYGMTINVVDGAIPSFNNTCNTDTVTLDTDFNICEATGVWSVPVAMSGACSDNMILPLVASHQPGTLLPIGYTTVTYTATSPGNLSATCQFVVEVVDNQNPSIYSCPVDVIVQADGNCEKKVLWTEPGVFDNCQNVTMTSSHNSGDTFDIGTTVVTYTAIDASGNTATCSFNVVVEDNDAPVLVNCPPSITVGNDVGVCEAVVSWVVPSVTDECSYTLVGSHNPGDTFDIGTTVVTYTATDASGNVSTCSFNITVEDNVDPVIMNCPSDIALYSDATSCGAIATWITPTSSDNCMHSLTSSHNSGDLFSIGSTVVTYTATDSSGNSTTCSFTVLVVDTIAPVISGCPSDILLDSESSLCGATATWTVPVITDNCGVSEVIASHQSGTIFPMGTTTVTYTAVDSSGNVSTCSFDVVVTDVTSPILLNCPSDITTNSFYNLCAAPVHWSEPTISDPCSQSFVYSTYHSGDIFNVGTTTVTYYVTDVANNTTSCSFDVTVTDISSPQITSCPENQVLEASEGVCTVPAGWSTPIAIDNCSGVVLTSTYNSGDAFPVGSTVVSYIATDDEGLQAVCTFSITVIDPNGYCGTPTGIDSVDISVPQAITPDGDGVNDFLVIKDIEHFPDNELVIFNRWGNEVYRESGYSNQWDGFVNVGTGLEGSQLPTGTYFYVLDTKDKYIGVLKGYIYLQR